MAGPTFRTGHDMFNILSERGQEVPGRIGPPSMQPQAVPSALRTSVPMQQRSSSLVPLARDAADTWRQATRDDLRRSVHFPLEHQPAAPAQHLAPASAGWTSHEVPLAKSRDFQLQPLEASQMVSVPGQLQTKFADMQQSQGFMMQQYLQVAQALGASEAALGDMRQLVLASQRQTTDLAKRVMETDGRLASGMEELTRLRNEQNYAAQHSGGSHQQLQSLSQTLQELQRSQAASDVAAQSDRRDVATLHGALLQERTAFQAEIARRDARIDQLAQESRHQERLLADHLMKLESNTVAQHHEAEHAKVQLEGALERLAQRAVMDQRTAESVRMADAQQKQDITSEVANLQANLAGETVRLQGSLQVAQRSVMELSQKLESERQARHEDSQAFQSKLTHAHTEAESMIRQSRQKALDELNVKSKELLDMQQRVESNLSSVDQRNKRELQMADQFLASIQAKDKETFLERVASLEGTLKESITHQLDAEAKLAGRMQQNSDQMQALMDEAVKQGNSREAVLRDQLDEALQKLRNYSRDIEQGMEAATPRCALGTAVILLKAHEDGSKAARAGEAALQLAIRARFADGIECSLPAEDRLELEQVIRAEISARMDSFKQLKQEAADQNEIFHGQLVRAERKIDIVLDAQRQVNSKADVLRVDLNSFETSTAAQFTSVNENVAKETLSLKKRLDREVEHMTDALKSKGDELDNTLQNGLSDLQEDTASKLDKFWQQYKQEQGQLRKDLTASDASLLELMNLLRKDHEDATSRLEATALEDAAAFADQMDAMQQSITKEKDDIRQLVDTTIKEAVDPLDELLEAIDSRQALTQGSLEGLEENTDQRCTDLESAASKLKDELAQARRGAEATAINLKEECGKWQQSMARTTAEFTAKTSNLHSEIALVSQDLMDNISDQKLAEEMLKLAVDDASSVAARAVSENAMTRGRVDKLRDEMLATVSGEADKRADSVAAIRSLLAANAKDSHAELTQLAGEIQELKKEDAGQLLHLAQEVKASQVHQQQALAAMVATIDATKAEMRDEASTNAAAAAAEGSARLEQLDADLTNKLVATEECLQDITEELEKKAASGAVLALQDALDEMRAEQLRAAEAAAREVQEWRAQAEVAAGSKASLEDLADVRQQLAEVEAQQTAKLVAAEQHLQDVAEEVTNKAPAGDVLALQAAVEEMQAEQLHAATNAASELQEWKMQAEETMGSKASLDDLASVSQQLAELEAEQNTMQEQSTQDMQSTVEKMNFLEEQIAAVRVSAEDAGQQVQQVGASLQSDLLRQQKELEIQKRTQEEGDKASNAKVVELQVAVQALEDAVAQAATACALQTLDERVAQKAESADVDAAMEQLSQLQGSMASVARVEHLTDMQSSISSLQSEAATFASKGALEAAVAELSAVDTKLAELQGQLEHLQLAETLDKLKASAQQLEAECGELSVAQRADASRLEEFQSTLHGLQQSTSDAVARLEARTAEVAAKLGGRAAQVDLEHLQAAVSSLEASSKTTASVSRDLQSTVMNLEATVAGAATDEALRAALEQISTKASSSDLISMQAAISSLEAGSKNTASDLRVSDLQGTVRSLEATVAAAATEAALQGALEQIHTKASSSDLQALQEAISLLEASSEATASDSRVSDLQGTVKSLEATVAAAATAAALAGALKHISTKASSSDLQALQEAASSQAAASDSQVSDLQGSVRSLEARVAAAATESALQSALEQISTKASSSDLQALQEAVSSQAAASDMQVGDLQGSVRSLEATVAAAATEAALQGALEQISTKAGSNDLKTLQEAVSSLEASSEATASDLRVSDLQGTVKSLEATVAAAATAAALEGALEQISTKASSSDVQALQEAVGSQAAASDSRVSDLQGTVKSLEATVAAAATAAALEGALKQISTKASSSDLQTMQSALQRVESALDAMQAGSTAVAVQQQLAEVQDNIRLLQDQIAGKAGEEDIQSSAAELRTELAAQSSAALDQLAALEQGVEALRLKLDGELSGGLSNAQKSTQLLSNRAADMDSALQEARSALASVKETADHAASAAEVSELADRLEALQGDMPSTQELADVKQQLQTLEAGMAALDGLVALRETVAALKTASTGAAKDQAAIDNQLATIQANMPSAQELADVKQQLQTLKSTNTDATADNDAVHAQLATLQAESRHAAEEQTALSQALKGVQDRQQDSTEDILKASNTVAEVQQLLETTAAELTERVERAERTAVSTAAASGSADAINEKLTAVEAALQRQHAQLDTRLGDMEGMVGESDAHLQRLQEQMDQDLDVRVESVETRLAAIDSRLEASVTKDALEQRMLAAGAASSQEAGVSGAAAAQLQVAVAQLEQALRGDLNQIESKVDAASKAVQAVEQSLEGARDSMALQVQEAVTMATAASEAAKAVEQSLDVTRDNLQLQVDQVSAKRDEELELQARRMEEMADSLRVEVKSDADKQQNEKLKKLESSLRGLIKQVAEAPVQLNLTPEVKKGLLQDVEKMMANLEAKIMSKIQSA